MDLETGIRRQCNRLLTPPVSISVILAMPAPDAGLSPVVYCMCSWSIWFSLHVSDIVSFRHQVQDRVEQSVTNQVGLKRRGEKGRS